MPPKNEDNTIVYDLPNKRFSGKEFQRKSQAASKHKFERNYSLSIMTFNTKGNFLKAIMKKMDDKFEAR